MNLMYQACGNGVCIRTDGSYQCLCYEGYIITSNGACQDTDECQNVGYFTITFQKYSIKLEANVCNVVGKCINLDGEHICECNAGYEAYYISMSVGNSTKK